MITRASAFLRSAGALAGAGLLVVSACARGRRAEVRLTTPAIPEAGCASLTRGDSVAHLWVTLPPGAGATSVELVFVPPARGTAYPAVLPVVWQPSVTVPTAPAEWRRVRGASARAFTPAGRSGVSTSTSWDGHRGTLTLRALGDGRAVGAFDLEFEPLLPRAAQDAARRLALRGRFTAPRDRREEPYLYDGAGAGAPGPPVACSRGRGAGG